MGKLKSCYEQSLASYVDTLKNKRKTLTITAILLVVLEIAIYLVIVVAFIKLSNLLIPLVIVIGTLCLVIVSMLTIYRIYYIYKHYYSEHEIRDICKVINQNDDTVYVKYLKNRSLYTDINKKGGIFLSGAKVKSDHVLSGVINDVSFDYFEGSIIKKSGKTSSSHFEGSYIRIKAKSNRIFQIRSHGHPHLKDNKIFSHDYTLTEQTTDYSLYVSDETDSVIPNRYSYMYRELENMLLTKRMYISVLFNEVHIAYDNGENHFEEYDLFEYDEFEKHYDSIHTVIELVKYICKSLRGEIE